MALVGKTLYVANTDAILAFPYVEGETTMSGKPAKLVDLPAKGTNRHWTKSLVAAPNGWLYVGVGADSNIGEKGMGNEVRRASVLEVRPENKYMAPSPRACATPSAWPSTPEASGCGRWSTSATCSAATLSPTI